MEELQLQLQSYSYDSIEKNVVYLPGLLNHSQHVCFDFTEHICLNKINITVHILVLNLYLVITRSTLKVTNA